MEPKVGIEVIILKDGKVLLHKRKGVGEGKWGLPSGHLEYQESFVDCAKREVLEEAGITIKNVKYAATTNDAGFNEKCHYVTVFVTAEIESGEPKVMETEKCDCWEWFAWNELPEPLFLPLQNLIDTGYRPAERYQHYHGKHYEVLGEAKHSETVEEMVVYRELYDSVEFGKNPIWVRPKEMFFGNVMIEGNEVSRFKKIN